MCELKPKRMPERHIVSSRSKPGSEWESKEEHMYCVYEDACVQMVDCLESVSKMKEPSRSFAI